MNRVAWVPAFLFALAVPLFLVTASVAWAFNDPGVYNRGFQKYRISLTTGITEEELRQVAGQIRHYFNSTDEPLLVKTQVYGEERELFNVYGLQHLVTLFQQRPLQGLMGLFPVPGTASGGMERFHDVHKRFKATQVALRNLFVAHGRIIGVGGVASQDNG